MCVSHLCFGIIHNMLLMFVQAIESEYQERAHSYKDVAISIVAFTIFIPFISVYS